MMALVPGTATTNGSLESVVLKPRRPFRLDLTVWALRRDPRNQVDTWDGCTYRRLLVVDQERVDVAVTQNGGREGRESPVLRATFNRTAPSASNRHTARDVLESMLSLNRDIEPFHLQAADDPLLAPLVTRFRGLRPPRFPTVFECLVNAVALQQFSLAAGVALLNRFAHFFTSPSAASCDHRVGFPEPADVAAATPGSIRALGFSLRKATTIIDVATVAAEGNLEGDSFAHLDDKQVVERLTQIPGIGRWSAEYTLLRGLGRLHVFPGDDVGARNNLARFLGHTHPFDYSGVQRATAPWHPYAGLVYFHLLLDRIANQRDINQC